MYVIRLYCLYLKIVVIKDTRQSVRFFVCLFFVCLLAKLGKFFIKFQGVADISSRSMFRLFSLAWRMPCRGISWVSGQRDLGLES